MESIHEFRTEIKKLRAFLRLLNVEIDDDSKLKISKKMKTFYGYAGTIRNLQLQLKNMDAYIGNPRYTVTETYLEYLKKLLKNGKRMPWNLWDRKTISLNDKKKILKQLPLKLRRASRKKIFAK